MRYEVIWYVDGKQIGTWEESETFKMPELPTVGEKVKIRFHIQIWSGTVENRHFSISDDHCFVRVHIRSHN